MSLNNCFESSKQWTDFNKFFMVEPTAYRECVYELDNNKLPNLYGSYDVNNVFLCSFGWFIIFLLLKDKCKKADSYVSMMSTYMYLFTNNIDILMGYYLYDVILCILRCDYMFIIHHTVSLVLFSVPISNVDFKIIRDSTLMIKRSDILLYMIDILKSSKIYKNKSKKIKFQRVNYEIALICSISITLGLWIWYRVIGIFFIYNETYSLLFRLLAALLHCGNIWWVYKLYNLLIKTIKFHQDTVYN